MIQALISGMDCQKNHINFDKFDTWKWVRENQEIPYSEFTKVLCRSKVILLQNKEKDTLT